MSELVKCVVCVQHSIEAYERSYSTMIDQFSKMTITDDPCIVTDIKSVKKICVHDYDSIICELKTDLTELKVNDNDCLRKAFVKCKLTVRDQAKEIVNFKDEIARLEKTIRVNESEMTALKDERLVLMNTVSETLEKNKKLEEQMARKSKNMNALIKYLETLEKEHSEVIDDHRWLEQENREQESRINELIDLKCRLVSENTALLTVTNEQKEDIKKLKSENDILKKSIENHRTDLNDTLPTLANNEHLDGVYDLGLKAENGNDIEETHLEPIKSLSGLETGDRNRIEKTHLEPLNSFLIEDRQTTVNQDQNLSDNWRNMTKDVHASDATHNPQPDKSAKEMNLSRLEKKRLRDKRRRKQWSDRIIREAKEKAKAEKYNVSHQPNNLSFPRQNTHARGNTELKTLIFLTLVVSVTLRGPSVMVNFENWSIIIE